MEEALIQDIERVASLHEPIEVRVMLEGESFIAIVNPNTDVRQTLIEKLSISGVLDAGEGCYEISLGGESILPGVTFLEAGIQEGARLEIFSLWPKLSTFYDTYEKSGSMPGGGEYETKIEFRAGTNLEMLSHPYFKGKTPSAIQDATELLGRFCRVHSHRGMTALAAALRREVSEGNLQVVGATYSQSGVDKEDRSVVCINDRHLLCISHYEGG